MATNIFTKVIKEHAKIMNSYEEYSHVRATYDRLIVTFLHCIKNNLESVNKNDAIVFHTHIINEIAYLYAQDKLNENANFDFVKEMDLFSQESKDMILNYCFFFDRLPDPSDIKSTFMLDFYISKILSDLYIFWQKYQSMATSQLNLLNSDIKISLRENYFTMANSISSQIDRLSFSDKVQYMNKFRKLHNECELFLNNKDNSPLGFLVKLEKNKDC